MVPDPINYQDLRNLGESTPTIQPGTQAYMNVRLPNGSARYVPVVAKIIDGQLQWVGGPSAEVAFGGESIPATSYLNPYRTIAKENTSGARPLSLGAPTGSRPEGEDTPRRLHASNDEAFIGPTIAPLDWERELGWAEYGLSCPVPNTMPFSPFIPPGVSNGGKYTEMPFPPFIPPGASNRGKDMKMMSRPGPGFARPPRAAYPELPMAFNREPSRDLPYTRFDQFAITFDLEDLKKALPPLPALLVPCDVSHADWDRCIQDLTTAWCDGVLPYNISKSSRKVRQLMGPSSAVANTIDIWNASFFWSRKVQLVLYRGLEKRSGPTAGKRSERLEMSSVPPQFQKTICGRKGKNKDEEKGTDDDSSGYITSPSTSDASDEGEEGVDEQWVIRSRRAIEIIRTRQKIEKKRRKLEKR
ncbi:hypothetical protein FRB90_002346, partial [Tulasnella sp. 427]